MYLVGIILLISCSDSTSSENTVTIRGTVFLEGRNDNSGVKVRLYRPVELDTTVVRLNEKYPTIGVSISQKTEFDHRSEKALYTTTSKSDGSWEINNVTAENHHIVAEKDSFGWKYSYNIDSHSKINLDTLYKSLYFTNILSNDISVNNSFLVIDDLFIPEGRVLRIGNGSTVLI